MGPAVLFLALALAPAPPVARPLAIAGARIHVGDGRVIEKGTVILEEGRIAAVGPAARVKIPEDARRIDANGRDLIPGIVLAHRRSAGTEDARTIAADVRAIDGAELTGEGRPLIERGVTAAWISPGERRLVSGLGAVVRVAGPPGEARILSDAAALVVHLGERPKNPPPLFEPPIPPTEDEPLRPAERQLPSVRPAAYAAIRRAFERAEERDAAGPAEPDPVLDALARVRREGIPLRLNAEKAGDILGALALARELGLPAVIEGGAEADRAAEALARAKAPLVWLARLRPGALDLRDTTRPRPGGHRSREALERLARTGIAFALAPDPGDRQPDPLWLAGLAVRDGLDPDRALAAITSAAARIIGVGDRLGTIERGKLADLVLLDGPLFATRTRPERVFVAGREVYRRRAPEIDGKRRLHLRGARIVTGTRGTIEGGGIIVAGGKIAYVGPAVTTPDGAEVVDLDGLTIAPGFIDLDCRLGTHADSPLPAEARDASGGGSAAWNLADAIDPADPAFREVARAGVTTVALAPGAAAPVSGAIAALKLAPRGARPLRERAGIRFDARAGRLGAIANLLKRAKAYDEKWKAWEKAKEAEKAAQGKKVGGAPPREESRAGAPQPAPAKKPEPKPAAKERPEKEEGLEPFRPLLRGEVVAFVVAATHEEIERAAKLLRDVYKIRTAILGPETLHRRPEILARREIPAILGPGTALEARGFPPDRAIVLREAGIPFGFRSGGTSSAADLSVVALGAVRRGLDPEAALRALTIDAARILGVDDRVGSIEKGKDADLVILTGEPLEVGARIVRVMVDGEFIEEAGR